MRIFNFTDCMEVFEELASEKGFSFEWGSGDSADLFYSDPYIEISDGLQDYWRMEGQDWRFCIDSRTGETAWDACIGTPYDTEDASVEEFFSELDCMLKDIKSNKYPQPVKSAYSDFIKTLKNRINRAIKDQKELAEAVRQRKKELNRRMSLNESIARDKHIEMLIEKLIKSSPKEIRKLLEKDLPKLKNYLDDVLALSSLASDKIEKDCVKIFKDQHECVDYDIAFSRGQLKNNRIDILCVITIKNWMSTKDATLNVLKGRIEKCIDICQYYFDKPFISELAIPKEVDFKKWNDNDIINWDGRIVIDIYLTADMLAKYKGVPISQVA